MDEPLSNLDIPLSSKKNDNFKVLRASMLHAFGKFEKDCEIFYSSLNRLFYWVFMPLFRELNTLCEFLDLHDFDKVIVHGKVSHNYSAFINRGDESRPFLYFPELLYPQWVVPILQKNLEVEVKTTIKNIICGLFLVPFRNALILLAKIFLLIIQRCRFLISQKKETLPKKSVDFLFLSRGLVSFEFFEKLSQRLLETDKNSAIFLNLSLRHALNDKMLKSKIRNSSVQVIDSNHYLNVKQIFSCLLVFFRRPKNVQTSISDGFNVIDVHLGGIIKEIDHAFPDTLIHRQLVASALKSSSAKKTFSTELVSEYVYFERSAAQKRNVPYYTMQAFAFEPYDALEFVIGEGIILQDKNLEGEVVKQFPNAKNKVFYFGDLNFKNTPNLNQELKRIVFFTQPYEYPKQIKILKLVCKVASQMDKDIIVIAKRHPRDKDKTIIKENNLHWVESGSTPNDRLISECDLVISRCSSVLHEVLMMNVPYLACTFTEYEKNFKPPYLSEKLGVRVSNLNELKTHLINFKVYRNNYHKLRKTFLKSSAKSFQIKEFTQL